MDLTAIEMARHPAGEQVPVEERIAVADTFGGRVRVEWDATIPVDPPPLKWSVLRYGFCNGLAVVNSLGR